MTPTPFRSAPMTVKPEWIDYNGHLNMAYYNVLFDQCADQAYPLIGFGPDYLETHNHSTFVAEFHVCYVRELHEGDVVTATYRIVDHDAKRFHTYQELWHEDGWLAATGEALTLHVDMSGPKVAEMPLHIQANLKAMYEAQAGLPKPERMGNSVGIRRR